MTAFREGTVVAEAASADPSATRPRAVITFWNNYFAHTRCCMHCQHDIVYCNFYMKLFRLIIILTTVLLLLQWLYFNKKKLQYTSGLEIQGGNGGIFSVEDCRFLD